MNEYRSPVERAGLLDPGLFHAAAQLDNVEALRMAVENRLRQATRAVEDSDGKLRGLGLAEDDPVVESSRQMLAGLMELERSATKVLERVMKRHPLGEWQRSRVGVGAKQLARLLASIGDPYWNLKDDCPRRVSQLWSYCGERVSDQGVAVRRRKLERPNWSTAAKSKVFLVAESAVRSGKAPGSPYYKFYAERKLATVGRLHVAACAPCGPAGKPAAVGSLWSDKHRDVDAKRVLAKEILRELWVEARRIHLKVSEGVLS